MSGFYVSSDRFRQIIAKKIRRQGGPGIRNKDSTEYLKARKIYGMKAAALKSIINEAFEKIPNNRFHIMVVDDFHYGNSSAKSYVSLFLHEDEFYSVLEFSFDVEKTDYDEIFSFFQKFNEKCMDPSAFPFTTDGEDTLSIRYRTYQELMDFVFESEFQKHWVFYKELCIYYEEKAMADLFNKCGILAAFPEKYVKNKVAEVPANVRLIKNNAFRRLEIEKIIIPNSVQEIEDFAFLSCPENIEIVCENPNLKLPSTSVPELKKGISEKYL